MTDALFATLTSSLGLSTRDLAEIGGFSERFARDLVTGRKEFPKDVQSAILDIQDDIEVMTDSLVVDIRDGNPEHIWMFRDTAQLRRFFPGWPGRGHAEGGFVGPYRIAAMTAWEALNDDGIHVSITFHESE